MQFAKYIYDREHVKYKEKGEKGLPFFDVAALFFVEVAAEGRISDDLRQTDKLSCGSGSIIGCPNEHACGGARHPVSRPSPCI